MLIPIIPNNTGKTYRELAVYHDCTYEQFCAVFDPSNPQDYCDNFLHHISNFYHEDGETCCFEHGTKFGDDDLIAAILSQMEISAAEWSSWSLREKHLTQREFVLPAPPSRDDGDRDSWIERWYCGSEVKWFQRYQRT